MSSNLESEPAERSNARGYQKPTLIRGPVLTSVTAAKSVSGNASLTKCWVARAAFGETDLRWMIFREWLVVDAPVWFHDFYVRHGEKIGLWLRDRSVMQAVVRGLMMPAVHRTLRK